MVVLTASVKAGPPQWLFVAFRRLYTAVVPWIEVHKIEGRMHIGCAQDDSSYYGYQCICGGACPPVQVQ